MEFISKILASLIAGIQKMGIGLLKAVTKLFCIYPYFFEEEIV